MNETDKKVDAHIGEAEQHLGKARELKSEGSATQIRALEKARDSVGKAIDILVNQPNRSTDYLIIKFLEKKEKN